MKKKQKKTVKRAGRLTTHEFRQLTLTLLEVQTAFFDNGLIKASAAVGKAVDVAGWEYADKLAKTVQEQS